MYNSSISVSDFVNEVLSAVNAVPAISGQVVANLLSDLQDRLFAQIIRPLRHCEVQVQSEAELLYVDVQSIVTSEDEAKASSEDVILVRQGRSLVFHATEEQFFQLSIPVYCEMNGKICLRNCDATQVEVTYIARPAPITYANGTYSGQICFPDGYLSMLSSGLRAELCRHIGDETGVKLYGEKFNVMLADLKRRFAHTSREVAG